MNEHAFALMDVLVAVALLALVALAVVLGSTTASRSTAIVLRSAAGFELARAAMEELAATDPRQLDDADDRIELGLQNQGFEFSRQVDVTVNADGSRAARVTVTPVRGGAPITLNGTFALWGTE